MSPRRAVVQFALASLAAVVLLGLLAGTVLRHRTRDEAIREAKELTWLSGHGIAEPALTPGLYSEQPQALAKVKRALTPAVLQEPVVRVKIWTADGRMLIFSALCNNWTAPVKDVERVQDEIAVRLAELTTPVGG